MTVPQDIFDDEHCGELEFYASYDAACNQLRSEDFHTHAKHMQFCLQAIIDGNENMDG